MIASAQTIRRLKPLEPFVDQEHLKGVSHGLGPAGYDVRIRESLLVPAGGFVLASTIERFSMPNNLLGIVCDKSTWARMGIMVQNTVIEPGWTGYLTLEITNHSKWDIPIESGVGIAQIIFHILDQPTVIPYRGKYQDQKEGPQEAIRDGVD